MKNYYQKSFSVNPIINWAYEKKLLITPLLLLCLFFNGFDSKGQCTPNTLAFQGSQPIYNSACGNTSYQNVVGSVPTGSGQTFIWEYSLNGGPFTAIAVTSKDLSKTQITNLILTPNGFLTGSYEIRRTVTDTDPGCTSSTSIFLYYSANSAQTTGGIASPATLAVCSPAVGSIVVIGNTGPVLRWESSTNGGITWTTIPNTTNTLNYNIINNISTSITTCYRALIDDICTGTVGSIDANDDYSTQSCITVSLGAPATPGAITGDAIVCPNSVKIYSILPVTNAASYTWTVPTGWTINSGQGTNEIEVTSSPICGATGNITVTASSGCATSDPSTLGVSAVDTTPPSITTPASSSTVQCDGAGNTTALNAWVANHGGAVASDVCGIVTWSNSSTTLSDLCGATGAVTVTFTATDDCGNTSTTTATFTIEDTTPPSITTPASSNTVQCDGAGNTNAFDAWVANHGGAVASDACGNVSWSNSSTTLSDLCGATGAVTVTFTATDDCGNTSTTTATFTIEDTTPPSITTPASSNIVQCDGAGNAATLNAWVANHGGAVASDVCGNVSWSNSSTTLSDLCGATGAVTVTFTATDACGNTSTTIATFTIEDTTIPVLAAAPQAISVQCIGNVPAMTNLSWTDNCSAGGSVAGVDGQYVGNACEGTITRTWNVMDDCGNPAVTRTQIITIKDTTPPVPPSISASASYQCFEIVPAPGNLTAVDNCSGSIIALGVDQINNVNACTTIITRTWTFTDNCGNTSTRSQVITVSDTQAPTITGPALVNVEADINCEYTVAPPTVTDNCSAPGTLTFVDALVTCFSTNGSGNINASGSFFPIAVASSQQANQLKKADLSFVTNQGKGRAEFVLIAPNGQGIVLVGNFCQGGFCEDLGTFSPSLYPNSSGFPIWQNSNSILTGAGNFRPIGVATAQTIADLPGITFVTKFEDFTGAATGQWRIYARKQQNVNGSIQFNVACLTFEKECAKIYTRTWSSTDACNNVGTFVQTIVVKDVTPPSITCPLAPAPINVESCLANCTSNLVLALPTLSDNCTSTDLITVNYTLAGATILATPAKIPNTPIVFNSGTTTVTYIASDACGNTSTCTYNVVVNCIPSIVIDGKIVEEPSNPTVITGTDVTSLAYISLIQGITILQTIPNVAGAYAFAPVFEGTYRVVFHTTAAGSLAPQLPTGYIAFSGEGAFGTAGDATPNGIAEITVSCSGLPIYTNARVAAANDISFGLIKAPLPVRLISFKGKATVKGNELTWKTSAELNFSHYEVERSEDAKAFKMIGKVNGAGNTKEKLSYSYLDESNSKSNTGMVSGANSPLTTQNSPLNYYRLKMVDKDGSKDYSKVIVINNEIEKSMVGNFYPNPSFGNETSININSSSASVWTISQYDLTGRIINTETRQLDKGENKLKFGMGDNRSGISIFRFENEDIVQYRKLNR